METLDLECIIKKEINLFADDFLKEYNWKLNQIQIIFKLIKIKNEFEK